MSSRRFVRAALLATGGIALIVMALDISGSSGIGTTGPDGSSSAGSPRTSPGPRTTVERITSHAAQPLTPYRVTIPAIGVRSAPVVRLGLNPDGTLEVPTNFADAGWWSGGTPPGRPGPTVIVGHVDSNRGPAVFYRLADLLAGDAVLVTMPGGAVVRYIVQGSMEVPKTRFPTRQVYGGLPYPALRLVTCGGAFNRATGHYVDNVIVFARMG